MFTVEGPSELPLEPVEGVPDVWRVTEPIPFVVKAIVGEDEVEITITVFEGFKTDVASTPEWLHWLFPRRHRKYDGAAVLHDFLYVVQNVTTKAAPLFGYKDPRKFADDVFYYHMRGWRRWWMWAAVRLTAGYYWKMFN